MKSIYYLAAWISIAVGACAIILDRKLGVACAMLAFIIAAFKVYGASGPTITGGGHPMTQGK